MTVVSAAAVLAGLTIFAAGAVAFPTDPPGRGEDRWADGFYAPGTGRVWNLDTQFVLGAVATHGDLLVFGNFDRLDNQPIAHVARFDGAAWHAMDPGTTAHVSQAVQDGEDVVLLFGDRSIRRWNGGSWTVEVPEAPEGASALALWNGQIVVAGDFAASGPVPAYRVARWTGAGWEPMGSGLDNGCVGGLAIYQGNLVAWGAFRVEAAVPAVNIAEWNGVSWKALDTGIENPVPSAVVYADRLYALSLETANFQRTSHLSSWNGRAWTPEDAVLPGGEFVAEKLVGTGSRMFVTGVFSRSDFLFWFGHSDPQYRWAVAEYQAGRLAPVQEVRGGAALDVCEYAGRLVSTGWFVSIGGAAAHGVAALDETGEWQPLTGGHGVDALWQDELWPQAYPERFVEFRGELLAAGKFTSAGGRAIAGIARYTPGGWQKLGAGVDGPVTAAAVLDDKLYVAGRFEHAGGQPANGVAVWDGGHWEPFGNERIQGLVETIVKFDGQIVVGGDFFYIGALQAPNLARWNGAAWERMPGTVFGAVHDLVVFGNTLLAGGDFYWNGRRNIGAVAAWNGAEWTTFGDRPLSSVRHLRLQGGELLAMSQAPGETRRLLRWTGSAWISVGQQPDANIQDAAPYQGSLVGSFSWSEPVSDNGYREYGRLYRLQGSEWVPLSRRFEADVRTVAPFGASLFCAGPFVEIDGHRAAGLTRWDGVPTAVVLQDLAAGSTADGIRLTWRVAPEAAAGIVAARIERSAGRDGLVPLGILDARAIERAPGAFEWTDGNVSPGAGYSYRVALQESNGEVTWAGPVSATAPAVAFGISKVALARPGGSVRIDYGIGVAGDAALSVYDVRGRLLRQLASGPMPAGRHTANWDRTAAGGARAAAGMYFVRLRAGAQETVRRVVLTN